MSIQLIIGPMFSSKTTEMFYRVKRYTVSGKRAIILRFKRDTRYHQTLASSYDLEQLQATSVTDPYEAYPNLGSVDVIGIDEGQFMPNLYTFAVQLAKEGRIVVIAALVGTFNQDPFSGSSIPDLLPMVDDVTMLKAICFRCGSDASFNRRIDATNHEERVIGGAEAYVASCRQCLGVDITEGDMERYRTKLGRLKLLQSK